MIFSSCELYIFIRPTGAHAISLPISLALLWCGLHVIEQQNAAPYKSTGTCMYKKSNATTQTVEMNNK